VRYDRVICHLRDKTLIVLVVGIGPRRDDTSMVSFAIVVSGAIVMSSYCELGGFVVSAIGIALQPKLPVVVPVSLLAKTVNGCGRGGTGRWRWLGGD
jgi:hypothetical protein